MVGEEISMTEAFTIRELEQADLPEVSNILAEGFSRHSLAFWQDRLRAMAQREPAPGTALFGYGLDAGCAGSLPLRSAKTSHQRTNRARSGAG